MGQTNVSPKPPFDLEYRPETYWPRTPTEETVIARIAGSARRDIARRAVAGEDFVRLGDQRLYGDAMEFVLQENLSESEGERWGAVNPAMMGGEYLPGFHEDEVEIVRIELRSVTSDVISVRARRENDLIAYTMVDEYADEGSAYELSPSKSAKPLTFGELISLIDSATPVDEARSSVYDDEPLFEGHLSANHDFGLRDPEALEGFVVVTSGWYAELELYYESRYREWAETKAEENAEQLLAAFQKRLQAEPVFMKHLLALVQRELQGRRLSADESEQTIHSLELEKAEADEAEFLGGGSFLLRLTVVGEAVVDSIVPKELTCSGEVIDADLDKWNKRVRSHATVDLQVAVSVKADYAAEHWDISEIEFASYEQLE